MDFDFLPLHHCSLALIASSYADYNFKINESEDCLQAIRLVSYHVTSLQYFFLMFCTSKMNYIVVNTVRELPALLPTNNTFLKKLIFNDTKMALNNKFSGI